MRCGRKYIRQQKITPRQFVQGAGLVFILVFVVFVLAALLTLANEHLPGVVKAAAFCLIIVSTGVWTVMMIRAGTRNEAVHFIDQTILGIGWCNALLILNIHLMERWAGFVVLAVALLWYLGRWTYVKVCTSGRYSPFA